MRIFKISNQIVTSVFNSIRNEHNYSKFSNTYHHRFLTYLTEWCRFLPYDAMRCTVLVIVILSVRLFVCLSVRHSRGLCPHGSTCNHDFFTIWYPHHSSFWGYHDHPKIRRGSPRARALNEGGVGTNWRFSTNKSLYLRNGARYDKGYY